MQKKPQQFVTGSHNEVSFEKVLGGARAKCVPFKHFERLANRRWLLEKGMEILQELHGCKMRLFQGHQNFASFKKIPVYWQRFASNSFLEYKKPEKYFLHIICRFVYLLLLFYSLGLVANVKLPSGGVCVKPRLVLNTERKGENETIFRIYYRPLSMNRINTLYVLIPGWHSHHCYTCTHC